MAFTRLEAIENYEHRPRQQRLKHQLGQLLSAQPSQLNQLLPSWTNYSQIPTNYSQIELYYLK